MSEKIFDLDKYAKKAREAVSEGIVLVKNDNGLLPITSTTKIAVFGRTQFNYYKSGTGSGGLVNTRYVTSILDTLEEDSHFIRNKKVKECYERWLEEHPFEAGEGWGMEPWFQEEMPLSENFVRSAKEESEVAVIIIGRTAGEDQDNKAEEGSYLLTEAERHMLKKVCDVFDKTVVLLNVGNIIDMKWVEEYKPTSVLYVWQGGQEGGNGVLDVLTGENPPSGKLTDTIAYDISDYPSTAYYGDEKRNYYVEDIYVGYRYFETFAKDKVLYPFGYGLSYTVFTKEFLNIEESEQNIKITVKITNTGSYKGKEVVQIYCQAPQGKLGKPYRSLCGFAKTNCLEPGESEVVAVTSPKYLLSSYDDSGITGHKSSYVLEEGAYEFYLGGDVRVAFPIGRIEIKELIVVQTLQEAAAPTTSFQRMKPASFSDEQCQLIFEEVTLRTVDPMVRRKENLPEEISYTGEQGWKLSDVSCGRISMETFIAQLSDEDLCCIVRGEGMSSYKVTPGTAGAFGGVTKQLLDFGIPIGCCADGPSGIRMDCGTLAFSLPNGTCLASSFNEKLSEELFEFEGLELRKDRIDTLLGPGINIHRNPLNGRNFEYFSEDPLLTGKIAAAQLRGMHKYGVTGTIKHFACNNQEFKRNDVETVISERALREMYLKGFEIAVKEGNAYSVMSTYGPVNGLWTASNYDLLTTILRSEWGFSGIVMTDWWAKGNDEGEPGAVTNTSAMVRSQNDLIMVTPNAGENKSGDNSMEGIASGKTARAEFRRSAANICNALIKMPAFLRMQGIETDLDRRLQECITKEEEAMFNMQRLEVTDKAEIDPSQMNTQKGNSSMFQVIISEMGRYEVSLTCRASSKSGLAQIPLSVFVDNKLVKTITLTGADTEWRTEKIDFGPVMGNTFSIRFYFGQSGMEVKECSIAMTNSV